MKRANDIGQHIAKMRHERGWTQEVMVARIQCIPGGKYHSFTRQILGNLEAGRTRAYEWHLRGIQNVLGCSYDEILTGRIINGQKIAALLKPPCRPGSQGRRTGVPVGKKPSLASATPSAYSHERATKEFA